MIGKKMERAINGQINAETYSAYLYLSMAADCEAKGLKGMAHWMRVQAHEEMFHAMKLFDYVNEVGGTVTLAAIAAPPAKWKDPVAVFDAVYKHERHVTSLIHGLVDLAIEERDHAANQMLQWFVTEQVEEEANAKEILDKLRMVGKGDALFMLDKELAARPFTLLTMGGAPTVE